MSNLFLVSQAPNRELSNYDKIHKLKKIPVIFTMSIRRIIYTSQATKQFDTRNLLNLLHDARAFNSIDKISGVLIHKEGSFLQIIEGESQAVDDLFTRLGRDPRHNEIKMIHDTSVKNRIFSNWAMGCADFDAPELSLIPGIRTDLNDPEVIEDLINRLPEIAKLLRENLD
ncbi:MAG: hypothetical protein ACJA0X_002534 [Cyclobacteriaceae bacterium]|jgi:hypothetical protein